MHNITPDTLIDLMPIIANRGWRVDRDIFIRDRQGFCPICAIVEEITQEDATWRLAAHAAMGSIDADDYDSVESVANAADRPNHWLRERLMLALGVQA